MLSLRGRQDQYRILFPDNFIPEVLKEKYGKILKNKKSFIHDPTTFLSETIQKIQILGFQSGTVQQRQTGKGESILKTPGFEGYDMAMSSSEYSYRNDQSPVNLIDKTLNIDFKHTLGYVNYFLLFESFFYQYMRDKKNLELPEQFTIEIFNEAGEVYSRIVIYDPLIDAMDMLDLDFTQPVAKSQTFRVIFKYSNIDFQFIDTDFNTDIDVVNPITASDIEL